MHRRRLARNVPAWTIAILSAVLPAPVVAATIRIAPVAIGGSAAPGTDNGVGFSSGNFTDLQINGSGTVLFLAGLLGPGVTQNNRQGMWIGRPGDLALAVRTSEPALDAGKDAVFRFLGRPVLGDDDSAAFYARVAGTGISEDAMSPGNDDTVWVVRRDGEDRKARGAVPGFVPRLIAQSGRTAEGRAMIFDDKSVEILFLVYLLAVVVFLDIDDDAESAAATGEVSGASQPQDAIVAALPGEEVEILAAVGDPAPGAQGELLSIAEQTVRAGQFVAFAGNGEGGKTVWAGERGAVAPMVAHGDVLAATVAEELGEGATHVQPGSIVAINNAGTVAYTTGVSIPEADGTEALIKAAAPGSDMPAEPVLIAHTADDAFLQFGEVVVGNGGDVAFTAQHAMFAPFTVSLWTARDDGEPALLLAEGESAPGLEAGEVVSFLEEGPFVNLRGDVVMRAGIGPAAGVQNSVDRGLWIFDPVDGGTLVARSGAIMDIGGGVTRELDNVSLIHSFDDLGSGGGDGRATILNDLGQLVFQAHWQEPDAGPFRSGVFVAGGACEADLCRDVDVFCKPCGQPRGQGNAPSTTDALAVLRAAVGTAACAPCICDTDGSGTIAATDSLLTLKRAVGQSVALVCPSA